MKSLLANLWKPRFCRMLGVCFFLGAFLLTVPYLRQTIFGPKIDGVPFCVWENQIRSTILRHQPKSRFHTLLEKVGLVDGRGPHLPLSPDLLPVFLGLANDGDVEVRRGILTRLDRWSANPNMWRWSAEQEAMVLPIMRQHLNDNDPLCRILAAECLWHATKDPEMLAIGSAALEDPDPVVQSHAAYLVCTPADSGPDSFARIAKLTEDSRRSIRLAAVYALRHFDKRGVPILKKALSDPDWVIQMHALLAATALGKDAEELTPSLYALKSAASPDIRRHATDALRMIESKRPAAD